MHKTKYLLHKIKYKLDYAQVVDSYSPSIG